MDISRVKDRLTHVRSLILFIALYMMGSGVSADAITRIHGSVYDASTQEAMPYVSVYLQNTTDGCQTDKDGHFSFLSEETKATLVVSSVGYEEQHISIGAHTKYPLRILEVM